MPAGPIRSAEFELRLPFPWREEDALRRCEEMSALGVERPSSDIEDVRSLHGAIWQALRSHTGLYARPGGCRRIDNGDSAMDEPPAAAAGLPTHPRILSTAHMPDDEVAAEQPVPRGGGDARGEHLTATKRIIRRLSTACHETLLPYSAVVPESMEAVKYVHACGVREFGTRQ